MNVTIVPRTGLILQSPVIAASGTFGYGTEFAERMDLCGLGAMVCKGTTREPRAGHEPLRVVETPAGMLNAIGLQNIGVEAVIREKAPIWAGWSVPVLVNVSGDTVDDYCYVASRLDGVAGVAGIELNVSCPNVRTGGVLFGVEPRLAGEVTAAVRAATELPLIVKLSPNVTDIREIAAAVAGGNAVESPAVRGEDDLLCEEVGLVAGMLLRDLDDDLMERGLDGAAELVPFFRHDREVEQELIQRGRELVDLGGRRVATGEDAEVDADLDPRLLVLAHLERDRRLVEQRGHA
jgi:hypothetical protein